MLIDETSVTRQLHRERNFWPPFCPLGDCKFHHSAPVENFIRYGQKKIMRFPYTSQRYQCKECKKTFTASRFRLDYSQKTWGHNEEIFDYHRLGVSRRETAREIGHSEKMVRLRLIRMSRLGMLIHGKLTQNIEIHEPLVYDGLENFSFSQYQPNNINHIVGKNSLFTYDFNFSPLNRKGRMSPRQEKRKKELEKKHGKFPTKAIQTDTYRIIKRTQEKCAESMILYSDRHYLYRFALAALPKKVLHYQVCSKIHRNYRNHLFAVNNIDMQARHNLAAFKRETIAFSKHSIAMQECFMLYAIYRNYLRPKFWGTHRSDPECSKKTPAMEIGVATRIFTFSEFFSIRVARKQITLNEDWARLYNRIDPLSRQEIRFIA